MSAPGFGQDDLPRRGGRQSGRGSHHSFRCRQVEVGRSHVHVPLPLGCVPAQPRCARQDVVQRMTRYILAELIPPLLAGVLLFTALLSFGYFFVSSQWLQGVPPGLVAQWIGYQLPDTLVKVLPMAAVLMTIVAFGRLNTERELVALQSGGIGLGQAGRPVAVVGSVLALLSLWLSLWVAPQANVETRSLYWDVLTGSGLSNLSGRTLDLGGARSAVAKL
ncbi:LptF/LptG family permease [Deinococcus radiophilus]|uniref:LptF/LptG family permease n=1 Tax=Deinococcus radiophilus TaxID=32062 RepID=UPI00360DF2C9